MSEPEIALVLAPDRWFDDVHRHCTDHGGARVRQVIVDGALALEEDYEVLVVSHRWPGLTRAFVGDVRSRGRAILGVTDPLEPSSAAHLAALGVDATIASDRSGEEFVAAVRDLTSSRPLLVQDMIPERPPPGMDGTRPRLLAVGGAPGCGATEVALGLSTALATRGERPVLVDADSVAPALAIRLGRPREPSLRTAIDAVEHGLGALDDSLVAVDPVRLLPGLPNVAGWRHVRPSEVLHLVDALESRATVLVADLGHELEDLDVDGVGRHALPRTILARASTVMAVGGVAPVAVERLIRWAEAARRHAPGAPLTVVVNRAPFDAFRRGEAAEVLTRGLRPTDMRMLPADRRVESAAWAGTHVGSGPFTKGLAALAAALSAGERMPKRRSLLRGRVR